MYVLTKLSEQAYRAGFREGTKMSLDRGIFKNRFYNRTHVKNLQRLSVWCSVGMDIEHGDWAILGAQRSSYTNKFRWLGSYTYCRL